MNKIVACGCFLIIMNGTLFAAAATANPTATPSVKKTTDTTSTPVTPAVPNATSTQSIPGTGSGTTVPVQTQNPTTILANQPMNCSLHIPVETTTIDSNIVMKWTEKALQQSYDFDFNAIDKQLTSLKNCYTDQGWQSFSEALAISGNVNAIKSQKLTASSMIDGKPQLIEAKDSQWRLTLPLQVVFQNDKEKITQSLSVYLVVGRKINGDLGIMQIIASPRELTPIHQSNATTATPVKK